MTMTGTAFWPLQQSVYQRLTQDATLAAMVNGIADNVPDTLQTPFLAIGDPDSKPFRTKTFDGEQITMEFHAWSSYKGKKETADILNAAIAAAFATPIDVPGYDIWRMVFDNMQIFNDDGSTQTVYHGIMRINFYIIPQ